MKKWMPTMLVVLVLIVGWVYAANQNYFREEEAQKEKLLDIAEGDIQSLSIERENAETAANASSESGSSSSAASKLELKEGVWTMTEPESYPLNGYAVSSWLDSLSAAEQEMVVEEQPQDLEKYGLGQSASRIGIGLKDGKQLTVTIGGQLPADNARYVRVNDGPVVAVQTDTVTGIDLTRRELLDTTPFNLDEANVQSADWEGEAATWLLKTNSEAGAADRTWTLNGKEAKADDAVSLLGKIKNLATADDVRKASELKNTVPRFTLSIEQTVNGATVTDVYRGLVEKSQPDTIWVVTTDGKWAYALQADALKEAENFPETLKQANDSSANSEKSDSTSSTSTSNN